MSPKSFKNSRLAPSGSDSSADSFSQMSSSSLPVSLTFSSSGIVTTATPERVVDSMRSILEFSASLRSTTRVTRSSTSSAVAPGQLSTAAATRTGIAGSLRWGMLA